MSGYDPKRPRRSPAGEEPAPVDALIDLASHAGPDRSGGAPVRVVTTTPAAAPAAPPAVAPKVAPKVTTTPTTPPVEGPHGHDDTARVVMALVAVVAAVLAAVAVLVLRRRR